MKKILLFITFFFLSISQSFSANNTFLGPDISMLPDTAVIGTASSLDMISSDSTSREQYCVEFGGTYVSHTTDTASGSAIYSGGQWDSDSGTSILADLTCDISDSSGLLYITGGTTGTGSTIAFMRQDNFGVYYIDEVFIIQMIVKFILTLVFITFMFSMTIKSWKLGRKLVTGRT